MQRTLREHITYLQQKIDALNSQLIDPDKTDFQRGQLRIDLGIAVRSLEHFQKAFDLEQKLSR